MPSTTVTPITRTREQWAAHISTVFGRAVQSIIETGEALAKAKRSLPHGEFEAMVRHDLPFSEATARKLRRIARHSVLSDRSKWNALPPSWTTLYHLAKWDSARLEAAIAAGQITPEWSPLHSRAEMVLADGVERERKNASKRIAACAPESYEEALGRDLRELRERAVAKQPDFDGSDPYIAVIERHGLQWVHINVDHKHVVVREPHRIVLFPFEGKWQGGGKQQSGTPDQFDFWLRRVLKPSKAPAPTPVQSTQRADADVSSGSPAQPEPHVAEVQAGPPAAPITKQPRFRAMRADDLDGVRAATAAIEAYVAQLTDADREVLERLQAAWAEAGEPVRSEFRAWIATCE